MNKAKFQSVIDRVQSIPVVEDYDDAAAKFQKQRGNCLDQLRRDTGRFFDCSFERYKVTSEPQARVFNRLVECAKRIEEFVNTRTGLVLWGRIGTGKDHLACALLRHAAQKGFSSRWVNGIDLYEKASQAWGDGSRSKVLGQYINCDCLVISDPVFLRNWSAAKSETLAKVVRGRYDKGRPTWITANAKDLGQLKEMCVPDVFDRITERAVIERLDWNSFRQDKEIQF